MPGGKTTLPPMKNMKITQYDDVAAATASSGEIYIIASDGVVIDPDSSNFELNEEPEKERFIKLPSIPEINKKHSDGEPSKEDSHPKWQPAKTKQSVPNTKSEDTTQSDVKDHRDDNALEESEYEYPFYQVSKEKRRFLYVSLVIVFALIALAIIYAAVKSAHEVPR